MIYALTGATGSFGSSLARYLLANTLDSLRLISRDEHKQVALMAEIPPSSRVSYVLCDIRDLERLKIAFHNVDVVVHAAALKIVPTGELHTAEMVSINVLGTQSVIQAAIANYVPRSLLVSSDKCCQPMNRYGATKMLSEGLFINANILGVSYNSRFSCIRGGNVWGSRGSVVERWHNSDVLSVTQPTATRFHLPMNYWLDFACHAIDDMRGGEVYVPKCSAWNLYDLAIAFTEVFPDKRFTNIPPRFGDRSHEFLISDYEASHTVDLEWSYVVEPNHEIRGVWNYEPRDGARLDHAISSDMVQRLTRDELKELIRK